MTDWENIHTTNTGENIWGVASIASLKETMAKFEEMNQRHAKEMQRIYASFSVPKEVLFPMTEHEWNTGTDPAAMLRRLTHERVHAAGVGTVEVDRDPPLVSDRKLRLFACACWRYRTSLQELKYHDSQNRMAEAGEIVADGGLLDGETSPYQGLVVTDNTYLTLVPHAKHAAEQMCARPVPEGIGGHFAKYRLEEMQHQASLLRCIFGNPFRPVKLPMLAAHAHPYQESDVVAIARKIYHERQWDEMPILADALEESGLPARIKCPACKGDGGFQANSTWVPCELCGEDHPELIGTVLHPILDHLRGTGPHGRGCWVIDTILGKE